MSSYAVLKNRLQSQGQNYFKNVKRCPINLSKAITAKCRNVFQSKFAMPTLLKTKVDSLNFYHQNFENASKNVASKTKNLNS